MPEENKSRLYSKSAWYHLFQRVLTSHLLLWNIKVKIYKIIILLVVLYGCETWSLILKRLRVFENKVLRRFGPTRDEVTRKWRKLQCGELHNLYSAPVNIRQLKSRRMRLAGNVVGMGEGRKVYKVLVGKPKGRDHLEDRGVDGRVGLEWI
jgi:hypothetical protein